MAARKPVTDEEIASAYKEGLSTRIIADRHGVDKTLVTRRLRNAGVPLRSRGIARKSEPVARKPAKRGARLKTDAVVAEVTTPVVPRDPLAIPATDAQLAEARSLLMATGARRNEMTYAHVRAVLTSEVRYRRRQLTREFERHEDGELL